MRLLLSTDSYGIPYIVGLVDEANTLIDDLKILGVEYNSLPIDISINHSTRSVKVGDNMIISTDLEDKKEEK